MSRNESAFGGFGMDEILVAIGGLLSLAAAALPWLTFSMLGQSQSVSGLKMLDASPFFNGVVTAIFGVVAAALYVTASERENVKTITVVFGVIVTLVATTVAFAPGVALGGGIMGRVAATASSPGLGAFAALVGGVLILVGGMIGYYGGPARQDRL